MIRRPLRKLRDALNDDTKSAVLALVVIGLCIDLLKGSVESYGRRLDEAESVSRCLGEDLAELRAELDARVPVADADVEVGEGQDEDLVAVDEA